MKGGRGYRGDLLHKRKREEKGEGSAIYSLEKKGKTKDIGGEKMADVRDQNLVPALPHKKKRKKVVPAVEREGKIATVLARKRVVRRKAMGR